MANFVRLKWTLPENAQEFKEQLISKIQGGYTGVSTLGLTNLDEEFIRDVPLLDDPTIDLSTSFQPASALTGSFGLLDLMFKLNNLSGSTSKFQSMFDLQVWQKTNPVKMTFSALFYTKQDPIQDVILPAITLMSLTVLTQLRNKDGSEAGTYDTPGVSLSTLNSFTKNVKDNKNKTSFRAEYNSGGKNVIKKAKIIHAEIPGIIQITPGVLKSAKPTISKERTKSGAPLWIKMDMEIEGVFPATDVDLLTAVDTLDQGLLGNLASFLG